MTTATQTTGIAFPNKDRIKSIQLAREYAGKNGRIATLPDIVNARMENQTGVAWNNWFSTATTEYYGESKGGTPIIIVAHGTGPLIDDPRKPERNRFQEISTRITKQQFLALESGKYGEVEVISRNKLLSHESQYQEILNSCSAHINPLLNARLGPRAQEFLKLHRMISKEKAKIGKESSIDLCFIANDHEYLQREKSEKQLKIKGKYFGHFISISRPDMTEYTQGEGLLKRHYHNPVTRIREDNSSNWYRFVGLRGNELSEIDLGIEVVINNIEMNYQKLMVPTDAKDPKFYALVLEGLVVFTQTPKDGARMDTGHPQFKVTKMEPIGTARFRTTGGSGSFFKYDVNEVKAIAPKGANAYLMGQPERVKEEGTEWHEAPIRFYNVTADTTKRMLTPDELRDKPSLVLKLDG